MQEITSNRMVLNNYKYIYIYIYILNKYLSYSPGVDWAQPGVVLQGLACSCGQMVGGADGISKSLQVRWVTLAWQLLVATRTHGLSLQLGLPHKMAALYQE